ncbi:MAG: tryptophan synthase subunit alpha [Dysgonamonadaceae bacterium]|jgi:tryptophan synthase alpha chain|nr:tryptophan synthase subunit alpha [Dysgonamonadaceae bacterium]
MNRINQLFRDKKGNILSVYFTAGYPAPDSTCEIIRELEKQGIDQIEIGIPFSDPMADGPVIQHSSTLALQNGMTLKLLFSQLENIRRTVKIPLILMGYMNPIIRYGFEHFCKDCQRTGIDGMIIPDLPFKDYMEDYKQVAEKYDLKIIMLITPDTSEERIRFIDEHTDGFIYMVSSASITGAQQSFDEQKQQYFRKINAMHLKNPRLIGFGISNKTTLDAAFGNASGGIIGSRFIQCLGEEKTIPAAVRKLLAGLNE